MAKQGLSNQLIGRSIRPSAEVLAMPDLLQRIWGLKPVTYVNDMYPPRYMAVVEAAWLEEGHVKVLARGPEGDIKELYMHAGLIEIEKGE